MLDGWWAEAFDGTNGWAIPGDGEDRGEDERDADALLRLLEQRGDPALLRPRRRRRADGWIELMRASLRTLGPRFSATRMLHDYVDGPYRG